MSTACSYFGQMALAKENERMATESEVHVASSLSSRFFCNNMSVSGEDALKFSKHSGEQSTRGLAKYLGDEVKRGRDERGTKKS